MESDQWKAMREWVVACGKTVKQRKVKQRNVREEPYSYKSGTMPLYAYEKEQNIQDPLNLTGPV